MTERKISTTTRSKYVVQVQKHQELVKLQVKHQGRVKLQAAGFPSDDDIKVAEKSCLAAASYYMVDAFELLNMTHKIKQRVRLATIMYKNEMTGRHRE